MVRALAIVAVLAGVARADLPETVAARDRGGTLLGLSLRYGDQPLGAEHRDAFGQALTFGGAVGAGFRLHGELELVWLGGNADIPMDVHGFGVRGQLAVRHSLLAWKFLYADVEAGGGVGLFDDSKLGGETQPDAFGGVRLGYVIDDDRRHLFEGTFEWRAIRLPEGWASMWGIGLAWGD